VRGAGKPTHPAPELQGWPQQQQWGNLHRQEVEGNLTHGSKSVWAKNKIETRTEFMDLIGRFASFFCEHSFCEFRTNLTQRKKFKDRQRILLLKTIVN
jgi:hypothetical protein